MIGLQYIIDLEEMTAAELSEKIGVSLSLVYRWLNGKKQIPKQRIIQIHSKVFPEYPEEYLDKEINEEDKTVLANIRLAKTATTSFKFKQIVRFRSDFADEVKQTLASIADLLNSGNTNLVQNPHMSTSIYMLMLATLMGEKAVTLKDFQALYNLEACKGQRSASILVSLVLSALSEAFKKSGYIDDIILPEPLTVILAEDHAVDAGLFDRKIHEQLTNVFLEIIEKYDKRDKTLELLKNRIKEEKQ